MAISSTCCHPLPLSKLFFPSTASFVCRTSDPSGGVPHPEKRPSSSSATGGRLFGGYPGRLGLSSALILRFPPNFVRQLSTKARRNCSNIGVAQIVAASWANNPPSFETPLPAASAASAVAIPAAGDATVVADVPCDGSSVQSPLPAADPVAAATACPLWISDGTLSVHAGERTGRGITTDAITTPVVNTSAYWFKNSEELIDFKEGRHVSFEYGRYGNPTTKVLENKLSKLETAESTLFVSSGMYATVALLSTLVPPGGHMVTTTDCYRKTRIFIENELPKMGISATVIDPADMDALSRALDQNDVSLFFTESPTNPFLRCVDIELVSKLCHSKGALVCIDGTFASPINQKALSFGADIVLHSATKFIAGHNDVLGGCLSGSEKLISKIRQYHHVVGGVINPNAAYLISRGVKTLEIRVERQNSTALRMAQFLEEHPKIVRVYYPGLPSHPEHHIAKRQMKGGFGGVVSFEVAGDLKATIRFIDSLKIPYIAPSFGGCESIVDQPAIMSYWDLSAPERAKYGIKDNLVRFSFGLEGYADLQADIIQALEKV